MYFIFSFFSFIFKLYIIVLVLRNIKMNPPQVLEANYNIVVVLPFIDMN